MPDKFDVVVVGGGPAGITAAIAAAANLAKVCLIERRSFLGGNAALGVPFQGFHDNEGRRIVGGLAWSIIEHLFRVGSAVPPWFFHGIKRGGGSMIVHDPQKTREGLSLLLERSGVDFYCNTSVPPKAQVYIDATGNGDYAANRGAEYALGNCNGQRQPATLLLICSGVDYEALLDDVDTHPKFYELEESCGYREYYTNGGRFALNWHHDSLYDPVSFLMLPKPSTVLLNMLHVRGIDYSESVTWGRVRQWIPWAIGFVRDHLPGCTEAKLDCVLPYMGIREGRRIKGDETLRISDMIAGTMFDNRIALGGRSVDLHDPSTIGTQSSGSYYRVFDQPYSIPWEALVPKGIDDVIVAGRCISVDYQGFGSTRMMGQCMATGEAAGTAAGLCVMLGNSIKSLDITALQNTLRHQGAILE